MHAENRLSSGHAMLSSTEVSRLSNCARVVFAQHQHQGNGAMCFLSSWALVDKPCGIAGLLCATRI